jgi:hypothetical protein
MAHSNGRIATRYKREETATKSACGDRASAKGDLDFELPDHPRDVSSPGMIEMHSIMLGDQVRKRLRQRSQPV